MLVEALVQHHVPGKKVSEVSEEIIAVATREAELLFELLDGIRPPDIGILSPRQVEHIAAYSQARQRAYAVEVLKQELENITSGTSQKFEHLRPGLLWAVELLSVRLYSGELENPDVNLCN